MEDRASLSAKGAIRTRLLGSWKLVSYVETDIETKAQRFPLGDRASGLILYTDDGFMSAQISSTGRRSFADGDMFQGSGEEYTASGQSYLAYSGPYRVDEEHGVVIHDIEISLFPNWAAHKQLRLVDFPDSNSLRLRFEKPQRSNGALKSAELIWKRP